jgi:hypothetical protein
MMKKTISPISFPKLFFFHLYSTLTTTNNKEEKRDHPLRDVIRTVGICIVGCMDVIIILDRICCSSLLHTTRQRIRDKGGEMMKYSCTVREDSNWDPEKGPPIRVQICVDDIQTRKKQVNKSKNIFTYEK